MARRTDITEFLVEARHPGGARFEDELHGVTFTARLTKTGPTTTAWYATAPGFGCGKYRKTPGEAVRYILEAEGYHGIVLDLVGS